MLLTHCHLCRKDSAHGVFWVLLILNGWYWRSQMKLGRCNIFFGSASTFLVLSLLMLVCSSGCLCCPGHFWPMKVARTIISLGQNAQLVHIWIWVKFLFETFALVFLDLFIAHPRLLLWLSVLSWALKVARTDISLGQHAHWALLNAYIFGLEPNSFWNILLFFLLMLVCSSGCLCCPGHCWHEGRDS